MNKLQFKISINLPKNEVYDRMLGISDKSTYEQWTVLFNPTSTYEGNWEKGSKILFVGFDENGIKGGMVSEVVANNKNSFVSVKHYGIVKGSEEVIAGPEVEKWANGFENYIFEESQGTTVVTVELDATDDFLNYMNETYPKALNKLKEICETNIEKK